MPLYRCTVIDEHVRSKPLLTMLGIILWTYYSVHVEMYLQKAFSDMYLLSQKCACICNFSRYHQSTSFYILLRLSLVDFKKTKPFRFLNSVSERWTVICIFFFLFLLLQISAVENRMSPHSKFQERQFWSGLKVSRKRQE